MNLISSALGIFFFLAQPLSANDLTHTPGGRAIAPSANASLARAQARIADNLPFEINWNRICQSLMVESRRFAEADFVHPAHYLRCLQHQTSEAIGTAYRSVSSALEAFRMEAEQNRAGLSGVLYQDGSFRARVQPPPPPPESALTALNETQRRAVENRYLQLKDTWKMLDWIVRIRRGERPQGANERENRLIRAAAGGIARNRHGEGTERYMAQIYATDLSNYLRDIGLAAPAPASQGGAGFCENLDRASCSRLAE